MLRVHCVQPFCNPIDPAMEDRLARRRASGALPGRFLRRFRTRRRSRLPPPAGAPRTGAPAVPEIGDRLAERGVLKKGGIVDATIISAPSSTGNGSNARDLEMHRTRKGNRWHFGMKLHIGTNTRGLLHHLEGTAANVHDLTPSGRLLHGEEEQVRGDSGYRGVGKRAEHAHREVSWQIALPPSKRRTLTPGSAAALAEKAKVRARVEHPFRIIKRVFGCDMVRYRGLERNMQRLAPLLGFSNLMIARPHLS